MSKQRRSSGLDVREAVSFASIHVVEERVQRRFDYVEAKADDVIESLYEVLHPRSGWGCLQLR
jgi:hypothetical protein